MNGQDNNFNGGAAQQPPQDNAQPQENRPPGNIRPEPGYEGAEKKCPQCGGTMAYDPKEGTLYCPYCQYREAIPQKGGEDGGSAAELNFDAAEDDANCDWGVDSVSVICKSCGAESVYDARQLSNVCPYCGSNQLVESGKKTMAPGGVIPFNITNDDARARYAKWLKGRFFAPRAAKNSKAEKFSGVYIPYWTFDTQTHSQYKARYGKDRTSTDKDGHTHTTTDWYNTSGAYDEFIDDEQVIGTERHDHDVIGKIQPYNCKENKIYDSKYLAGYASERYTVSVKRAWEKAKEFIRRRLTRNIEDMVRRQHSADHSDVTSLDTWYSNVTYKYLLAPIWISSFTFKNKVYNFMVNGQTGKVGGKSPVSGLKVALLIAAIAAAVGLIVWLYYNY